MVASTSRGAQTQIIDNTITGNTGCPGQVCFGGGVAVTGTVSLIQGNRIVSNTASLDSLGAGGGVYLGTGTHLVAANTISGNLAGVVDRGYGGGVYAQFDTVTLERNTILDNVASTGPNSWGGGVRIAAVDAFTMTNNIIARNGASTLGSGVDILGGHGVMANNTIVDNQAADSTGVAVGNNSAVTLTNTLIADQAVGIRNTASPTSTVTANTTLFDGVTTAVVNVTNLNALPGPAALLPNYHLGPGSNAIDHGLTLAWVTDDIDGNTRPQGSGYDVGADEAIFIYLPLVLKQ